MSSDYFDSSTLLVTAYALAKSTDVNDGLSATDVAFQKLPQPRADAIQSGKKGFIESFTIADLTEEDNPFSYKQWQSLDLNSATDTGSANSYAMALAPVCTAYRNGIEVKLFPANTNTSGTCTLSLNGLTAIPIKRNDGKVLTAGDISAAGMYTLIYYDGYFIISGVFLDNLIINDNTISAGDNITITQTGSDPYDFEIKSSTITGSGSATVTKTGIDYDVSVKAILDMPSGVEMAGTLVGGKYTNNATDSAHDIDFAAGAMADSTNTQALQWAALTKQGDATWAAGDNAGMMLTGTLTAGECYMIFVLHPDAGGNADFGCLEMSRNIVSYLPTGYSKYAFLGLLFAKASSAEFLGFKWVDNDTFEFDLAGGKVIESSPISTTPHVPAYSSFFPTARVQSIGLWGQSFSENFSIVAAPGGSTTEYKIVTCNIGTYTPTTYYGGAVVNIPLDTKIAAVSSSYDDGDLGIKRIKLRR